MKLLIIVLCLLSERYLVHSFSYTRFKWFNAYFNYVIKQLPQSILSHHAYFILPIVILPPLIVLSILIAFLGHVLFGFLGFLLNLVVFYYCLGPNNPFYPVSNEVDTQNEEVTPGNYFADINGQLFAVILWFIVLGPLGTLFYRLVSLCKEYEQMRSLATKILDLFDWVSARVTLTLYLLVGNFQRAFAYYRRMFFALPTENNTLLNTGGTLAAQVHEETVSLLSAQNLAEHALIVYLVLLAFFTLVAWL